MAPFGGGDGVYIAGHGDGIGLEVNRSLGDADRRKLGFSRLRLATAGRDGFAIRGEPPGGADIAGYSPKSPDDYKPNGIVFDQTSGDLHCFIARGTGSKGSAALANRRRAWVLTSLDRGRSWNVGDLPPLGRDPVFDATKSGGLVPIGVCQSSEGSVHDDGHVYLYFNRQGNAKSFDLYPSGNSKGSPQAGLLRPDLGPAGSPAEARARTSGPLELQLLDGRRLVGRRRLGRGDPGPLAIDLHGQALPRLVDPAPRQVRRRQDAHIHKSGWARPTSLGARSRRRWTSRWASRRIASSSSSPPSSCPSPAIADGNETIFPLVVSGAPYYDCLGLAAVEFERD
jgi:hypothetical protein